jgi:putative FmdB family regulatory protein
MPMYEYRCLDCGEEFEELVRSDDEQVECEACDSENVKRKMSTFATKVSGRSLADLPPSAMGGGGGSKCSGCSGGNCASC